MAIILTTLFAVMLILAGALILTDASLSSASDVSSSWDRMVDRDGDRARTELTLITADIGGGGTNIDISVRNTGQTALVDFKEWDAVIQYYETASNQDLRVLWLPYASPPAHGQWEVVGIYMDAGVPVAEVYEPNVFNPGEEMVVRVNITPAIPANTDNLVTIGAANGVTLAAPFSR